ncbi:hypothetical protein D3C77_638520 [compost metagenome]
MLIDESAKAFRKRSLTAVVGELTIDNAVAFLANEAIDAFDKKLESRVFSI